MLSINKEVITISTKETALQLCDCSKCDRADKCKYKGRFKRLPRELYIGAQSKCPKIKNEHF